MIVDSDIENDIVKITFQEEGFERQYVLTSDNLIIFLIRNGEIINSKCFDHEDENLLPEEVSNITGALSVSLSISDLEDPDGVTEPHLRVEGMIGGLEFCLPPDNIMPLLTRLQAKRVKAMILKLQPDYYDKPHQGIM